MSARSGCYLYARNDEVLVRETWTRIDHADQSVVVQCVRDAEAFGTVLSLNAFGSPSGAWRFEFERRVAVDGPVRESAVYRSENGTVWFGAGDAQNVISTPEDGAFLFPLMRIFTGDMVRAILDHGGQRLVIVPSIATLDQSQTVFAPQLSQRTCVPVSDAPNTYHLSGGAYEEPVTLSLTNDGLLAHYAFNDKNGDHWRCWLNEEG